MSVFISGASGFIAQHIVGELLKENYKVIGTVRNQAKADDLLANFKNPNLSLEIVSDISRLDAFDEAFKKHAKDIKIVLHTASPLGGQSDDYEKSLLIPARNGTLSILGAVKKYGAESVERFVLTSSYAAMIDHSASIINEESWNPDTWDGCQTNSFSAYCGSKKFAEKAAWDFLEQNKGHVKMKLTTVNPVFVFGPQKFDASVTEHLNATCEPINQMIHGSIAEPFNDTMSGSFVDVRDVAKAHLLAFQSPETVGKRLMLCETRFSLQDILDVLNEDFPQLKGKIQEGKPHTGAQHAEQGVTIDNSKTKNILGFKFRTFRESIDDTCTQILKHDNL